MTARAVCAVVGSALFIIVGCSKPESSNSATVGPTRTTPDDAGPVSPPPVAVAPRDLDVRALQKDLGCDGAGHPKACRILKQFAQAQRFTARTPSGEGRWIGPAIVVERGTESMRHLVLWCKSVPTSQVGPGDLAVKAGYELIPLGLKLQSEKLMRALTRAADPPESNPAYRFAHAFVPKEPHTLASTAGPSVHVTAEESTYLRFSPPRTVYLVNPARAEATAGDGIYAELWLGDW